MGDCLMSNKPDNIVGEEQKRFDDFDKLNLKSFAKNLLQNMEKGTASNIGERGAWTISLNAEFGNGKTTFLEMFKAFIEDENKEKYNVISINAWESDFYGQPIIAILSELSNLIKIQDSKNEETIEKITKIIGKIANHKATRLIGNVANQVIDNQTGFNIKETMTSCRNKNTEKTKIDNEIIKGQNILEELNQRKSAIDEIKKTILEYTKDKKLIIIVDELDRARPDYAVHFLEDIKHFFDIEDVVFLVAVNRKQMSATVKCLYGQELDFGGYYRKFFKQEIDLPDPYKSAQNFINDLIKKTKVKYSNNTDRSYRINNYYLSCKIFELTLREVETGIRIFENILGSEANNTTWTYLDCYPFFICLYIKNKRMFNRLLNENFSVNSFLQSMSNNEIFKHKYQKKSHDINYLLGEISCSFIKNNNDILQYKELIKENFPEIVSAESFFTDSGPQSNGWKKNFILKDEQPALEMCQNIYQHKSVFKE